MRKILTILLALILTTFMIGCTDFLNTTPNKSGSAYIYHMDQLYGLTGNTDLFIRNCYPWADL
ncbi:MAG: hypothetical protein PHT63_00905, partial [Bacteroidales bacterium]|nr:hypothetical protein [Bacteroidales bacterium]